MAVRVPREDRFDIGLDQRLHPQSSAEAAMILNGAEASAAIKPWCTATSVN